MVRATRGRRCLACAAVLPGVGSVAVAHDESTSAIMFESKAERDVLRFSRRSNALYLSYGSPPESGVRVVSFNCFLAVLVLEGLQATHGDFSGLMRFVAPVFTRLSDILSNPRLHEQAETNLVVDPMTTYDVASAQGQCPSTDPQNRPSVSALTAQKLS